MTETSGPGPRDADPNDVSEAKATLERWDAIVLADEPGVWAFHCHILNHAESATWMFGMVTALIVA